MRPMLSPAMKYEESAPEYFVSQHYFFFLLHKLNISNILIPDFLLFSLQPKEKNDNLKEGKF